MTSKMKRLPIVFVCAVLLLLSSSNHYAQKADNTSDWKRTELDFCSFLVPLDLTSIPVRGIDSAIWKFKSDSLILMIDLGLYSGKPDIDEKELDYVEKRVKVDKKKGTIVRFKYREPTTDGFDYVTAIYFPKIVDKFTKLSFVVHSKTPEQQNIAEKMLLSINFN